MYPIYLNHSMCSGGAGNLPPYFSPSMLMRSNYSIESNSIYRKAVELQLISPVGINSNIQNFAAGSLILRKSSSAQGITCITVIEIQEPENISRKLNVKWSAEINSRNFNQLICRSNEGVFSVNSLVDLLVNYRHQINALRCDFIQDNQRKVQLFNYKGESIGDVPLDDLIALLSY